MAKNRRYARATQLVCTVPSGTISGAPVVVGQRPGVALTDRDATAGTATVQFDGAFDITVNAVDGSGNSAVAEGDILYYVVGDTIKVSKKATGVRWGYAHTGLASGTSGTVTAAPGY